MNYHILDMEQYARKKHFDYFRGLAYPYVGVTVSVTITSFLRKVQEKKLPFFLTFCYCVTKAANAVREFRQRIVGESIVEFAWCETSHTVALEDGTYCYCTLQGNQPLETYLPYAIKAQEQAKMKKDMEENQEDSLGYLFLSTVPWFSYEGLVQPVPIPADSNPRITWGKYEKRGEEVVLPVSVLCHHALVDGFHISQFYEKLYAAMEEIC